MTQRDGCDVYIGYIKELKSTDMVESEYLEVKNTQALPARNPLHHEALTIDDLETGTRVRVYMVGQRSHVEELVIVSEPWLHKCERSKFPVPERVLMVSVVAVGPNGTIAKETENKRLCDMGIVPWNIGGWLRWNDHIFSLEA